MCETYQCEFMSLGKVGGGGCILVAVIAHHTLTLMSWIGMRSFAHLYMFWEFHVPLRWNQAYSWNLMSADLFLHPAPCDISSQYSVLLHHLCHRGCEPQLSYLDASVTVMLDFLLMMQTCPFVVQVEAMSFLDIFSILAGILSSTFSMFSSCLEWNLLLEPL